MNREELTFDGFVFANHADVELAKNEAKKIAYIENHTDMTNINTVRALYEKLIENATFTTPIGFLFLKDLRNAIVSSGVCTDEELAAVPLYTTFRRISLKDEPGVPKKRLTPKQREELSIKEKYRNAVIVSVILGLLAAAMLVITLNGTTPNAINYKRAITNEYSAWEQDLKERESAVREKERELNINSYGD